MRVIPILLITLITFGFHTPIENLPLGIYATHKGTTAICLELMEDEQFKMILSTCNEDKVEEGSYSWENDILTLTSNRPPRMTLKNLRPADSSLGEGLILKSPDPVILSQCQLSLDNGQSKFNYPYQSTPLPFDQPIMVYYQDMEPIVIEPRTAEDITTWQADIVFENMHSEFAEFQSWIVDGKKLRLNQTQSEVRLKKSKKCWLY